MILTILRIFCLRLRNNPLELLLVFVMPVVFFSIFAVIFSKGIATGSDTKLRVGWISSQQTPLGTELRAFLETNSSLECTSLVETPPSAGLDDATMAAEISAAQQSGQFDLIVRLPGDFPDDIANRTGRRPCVVSLVTDGQNPVPVAMVTSVVSGFFAQKQATVAVEQLLRLLPGTPNSPGPRDAGAAGELKSASAGSLCREPEYFDAVRTPADVFGSDDGSRFLPVDESGVTAVGTSSAIPERWVSSRPVLPPEDHASCSDQAKTGVLSGNADKAVSIVVENPQAASQENPRIAMYAAGIAVLFLLFSATGHAAALLEEAESGTLDRILVSRAGLFHIIGGKWLGILLLGCLQITVMFLWADAVFGIQLGRHVVGFCVMTFSTAAATASFAMLLATVCRSRAQLNAASVVIVLSMSAVGGSMIPRFAMSERMKDIGKWTFNAWALDGYQKVFWFQSPVSSLQMEVTVLLGSSVALGLLTLMLSGRWKRG